MFAIARSALYAAFLTIIISVSPSPIALTCTITIVQMLILATRF